MKTDSLINSINEIVRRLVQVGLVLPVFVLLFMNFRLYYTPSFEDVGGASVNQDVYHQLRFIKERLNTGEGDRMQQLFPEGYIFINVLYGLSWSELLRGKSDSTSLYHEGLSQIEWAYNEINSAKGKEIFDESLPLKYGAFYKGWSTYLLAQKLSLESTDERDSVEIQTFKESCELIVNALRSSTTPFLESYRIQQAWPADMFPCILSLVVYDELFGGIYETDIQEWIGQVKSRLDPVTGLIPHSVQAASGTVLEGARGSSQSLMLNFLIDIDSQLGKEQYAIYKDKFLDRRFGLPGVREYPKGVEGKGDVDSGPVILGIGGSASIVGQRTAGQYYDWTLYEGLRNSIEVFGCPYTSDEGKQYIFGQLPMADAFIAWSNSIEYAKGIDVDSSNWQWRFQLLSLAIITLLLYLVKKI